MITGHNPSCPECMGNGEVRGLNMEAIECVEYRKMLTESVEIAHGICLIIGDEVAIESHAYRITSILPRVTGRKIAAEGCALTAASQSLALTKPAPDHVLDLRLPDWYVRKKGQKSWHHLRSALAFPKSLVDTSADMCIHESYTGVVSGSCGDEVVVMFDGKNLPEQVYHRSQFVNKELPNVGDRLHIHVVVTRDSPSSGY